MAQVKKALQHYKKTRDLMTAITSYGSYRSDHIQIGDDELDVIAKLFNLDIQKTNTDHDSWHGSIYLEGLKLFCFKYDFEKGKANSYRYKETKRKFKQAFFECDGDKVKAFELLKKNDNSRYPTFKNYKTLDDLSKFWSRNEEKSFDQTMQEFHSYRSQWEEKTSSGGDRWSPFTFRQWYESKN